MKCKRDLSKKKKKIKTINSKITINTQLSTTASKKRFKKLSKELEQEQSHRNGDHMEGKREERGKGTGNEKHNW